MGNQTSKGKEGFESFPSFTRSDTQGSTRSFNSLRKKIKGGNNGDQSETNSIHGSLRSEKSERYAILVCRADLDLFVMELQVSMMMDRLRRNHHQRHRMPRPSREKDLILLQQVLPFHHRDLRQILLQHPIIILMPP
jgi:hypothetical protein